MKDKDRQIKEKRKRSRGREEGKEKGKEGRKKEKSSQSFQSVCNISPRLRREFDLRRKLAAAPRTGPSCGPASWRAHPACPTRSLPAFVRRRKPAEGSLMHPFQWCNGCFCGLGLVSTNKSCSMPPISFQDLPLNIYMVIFGTGIFVFMLSLIFCCYFISKLRNQAQSERYGYKEVSGEVAGGPLCLPHVQQAHCWSLGGRSEHRDPIG
nr:RING finger protein 122 isoform X4 [Camelus dromedarius]